MFWHSIVLGVLCIATLLWCRAASQFYFGWPKRDPSMTFDDGMTTGFWLPLIGALLVGIWTTLL